MDITTRTGETVTVTFKWDIVPGVVRKITEPLPVDDRDYCGSVFFGNYKLEFIRADEPGPYCNMFEYGIEDGEPGTAYSYLPDSTPYEERCDFADSIDIPARRTLKAFARKVEAQICEMLRKKPDYIPAATVPTDPDKWYPGDHAHLRSPITHIA